MSESKYKQWRKRMNEEYEGFIDSWEDYVSGVGEGISEEDWI